MDFCRGLCKSFNFLNMKFVVKFILFAIKFYRKVFFIESLLCNFEKFVTEFCHLFYHHICSLA